ncbi:MAG TPA: hypothetical protein VGH38_04730 [Bryobacteraceae bacterium]
MKITRRTLAAAVLVPAAAALAQTPAPPPSTPEQELKAARDRTKALGDALAQQTVPMDTEPALQFKA